jgi:hypothetical protein
VAEDELATLSRIRNLLRLMPVQVEPGKFAGTVEQMVADLYFDIGYEAEAGHWFVLSARKAESCTQDPFPILEYATKKLPNHLELRAELKAMKKKYLGEE